MELQEKYLKPLPDDKERKMKVASDLKELRNKVRKRGGRGGGGTRGK